MKGLQGCDKNGLLMAGALREFGERSGAPPFHAIDNRRDSPLSGRPRNQA
jgi:hypothetical protein